MTSITVPDLSNYSAVRTFDPVNSSNTLNNAKPLFDVLGLEDVPWSLRTRAALKMIDMVHTEMISFSETDRVVLVGDAPGAFYSVLEHHPKVKVASLYTSSPATDDSSRLLPWDPSINEHAILENGNVFSDSFAQSVKRMGATYIISDAAVSNDYEQNHTLFIAVVDFAVKVLKSDDGVLVMKIFDPYTMNGSRFISYVCSRFGTVEPFKPYPSVPTNSERYLKCTVPGDSCEPSSVHAVLDNMRITQLALITGEDTSSDDYDEDVTFAKIRERLWFEQMIARAAPPKEGDAIEALIRSPNKLQYYLEHSINLVTFAQATNRIHELSKIVNPLRQLTSTTNHGK